jgi:hypothetical protein
MLTYGILVVLHHENARPYTAARTRALLEHLNQELSDHPPHRPLLAPSECHLFTRTCLKNRLGSQSFSNNDELIEGIKTWLSSRAADFFDTGT